MQEQTTYPALLSIDTIPAPIALSRPSPPAEPLPKKAWPQGFGMAVALILAVWILKRWW
jgi:hypothetical protein